MIIKGIKKDGTIDVERKSTPVLITELISKLPGMCEADICRSLEEIRLSSEQDERIRKTYCKQLMNRIEKERNRDAEV